MKAVVLTLISLFATGNFQTARPRLIEVQEGDDVTVHCQTYLAINLEKYTLDVKRVNGNSSDLRGVVYSRRHGKDHHAPQLEQYRNRVSVIDEDLRVGVVSVVIRSVRRSDGGLYKCYIPRLRSASSFAIVVKDKQDSTKENDFNTMATSVAEMTDAGDAGAATKEHHHDGVIIIVITIITIITILCLLGGFVFLVLFKKGMCMSRKGSEGNSFELKALKITGRR